MSLFISTPKTCILKKYVGVWAHSRVEFLSSCSYNFYHTQLLQHSWCHHT
jgi:hypothetical protein